jgi:hypothetical protein
MGGVPSRAPSPGCGGEAVAACGEALLEPVTPCARAVAAARTSEANVLRW